MDYVCLENIDEGARDQRGRPVVYKKGSVYKGPNAEKLLSKKLLMPEGAWKEKEAVRLKVSVPSDELEKRDKLINALRDEIGQMKSEAKADQVGHEALKAAQEGFEKKARELKELNESMAVLHKTLSDKDKRISDMNEEAGRHLSKIEDLSLKLDDMSAKFQGASDSGNSNAKKLNEANVENASLKASLDEMTSKFNDANRDAQDVRAEKVKLELEVATLKTKVAELEKLVPVEPVVEEPVMEELIVEPVVEAPIEEPVIEAPVEPEPVVEPVVEEVVPEPVVEDPIAEPAMEPAVEPVAEEPAQ